MKLTARAHAVRRTRLMTVPICYALDIGIYETGAKGQMLSATTAAWCRAVGGTPCLKALVHDGTPTVGRFSRAGGTEEFVCGRSIEGLAQSLVRDLGEGHQVALGFEAPMWLPLEHKHNPQLRLFCPRFDAEQGSEWYRQSGAAASLKSIVLGVLLREHLRAELGGALPRLSTDHADGGEALVLFEAFVAGPHKVLGRDVLDETDALVAAIAWGAIHRNFALPGGFRSVLLHKSGSRTRPCLSLWSTIFTGEVIAGPPDCDVVALAAGSAA